MPEIAHPDDDEVIEVAIVDEESHHGHEMIQVEAVSDGIKLTDEAGEAPWLFVEDLE